MTKNRLRNKLNPSNFEIVVFPNSVYPIRALSGSHQYYLHVEDITRASQAGFLGRLIRYASRVANAQELLKEDHK